MAEFKHYIQLCLQSAPPWAVQLPEPIGALFVLSQFKFNSMPLETKEELRQMIIITMQRQWGEEKPKKILCKEENDIKTRDFIETLPEQMQSRKY